MMSGEYNSPVIQRKNAGLTTCALDKERNRIMSETRNNSFEPELYSGKWTKLYLIAARCWRCCSFRAARLRLIVV